MIKDPSQEQIVGQRLMVGFNGTELNSRLKYLIKTLKVGGIILFSRNLEYPDQIRKLCFSMQEFALSCGQPPLFIAIDQEGGQVARLKEPFTQFPGNPAMQGKEDAVYFARTTASELSRIGINMNMAPVLDIAPKAMDSIMKNRAFGHDPDWVAELGLTVIKELQSNGIIAVAKHFPGIGRTVIDSHLDLPTLDASLDSLEAFDLIPFKAAIDHEVGGVMLSHIHYPQIDQTWPASISIPIVKSLLREKMNYQGLVMTDDLDMGAIEKHFGIKVVIRQLLEADVDIALVCHESDKIEQSFYDILHHIQSNAKLLAQCLISLERIFRLKQDFLNTLA